MQRAREALNVAASLVRGQLNVMGGNSGEEEEVSNVAPGTPPQQLTRNCSRSNHSNTSSAVRKAASSAEPGVSGVVAEEVSSAATVAPLVRGSTSVPVVVPAQEQASFYASTATRAASHLTEHVAHRHHGIDVRDENDTDEGEGYGVGGHDVEGVYDDEDDYEEGEEGYWDDDGYFHYYDDDEGYYDEEGNYYAYADDTVAQAESECVGTAMGHYGSGTTAFDDDDHYYDDEAYDEDGEDGEDDNDEGAVFRPPPRTHSPPAL